MTTFNEYTKWLDENKLNYTVEHRNGKPYSITAHLKNQFGDNVERTYFVFKDGHLA